MGDGELMADGGVIQRVAREPVHGRRRSMSPQPRPGVRERGDVGICAVLEKKECDGLAGQTTVQRRPEEPLVAGDLLVWVIAVPNEKGE